ncbi:MAG: hypothetical protein IH862_11065 [Chloroflexi bacterium]|nr:hypothetical protein [Chloroflexota bacterium]
MESLAEQPYDPLVAATSALGKLARSLAVAALSGFTAGAIVGGIGSRVAMRIVAVASGPDLQGALTEAEARVGEITADGTFFLFVLGGFIGVIGGLAFLALRPWLADAGRWKGLALRGPAAGDVWVGHH